MRLLVFVSDDGTPDGTGPTLFLPDHKTSVKPKHPRGMEWRYFATIAEEDNLFAIEARAGLQSIRERGHYIAQRLVV